MFSGDDGAGTTAKTREQNMMKRMLIGLAAVFLIGSAAHAAQPWKTIKTSAGTVWATESGMTLYTFDKDRKNKSSCDDQCAAAWPPFKAASTAKTVGGWTVINRTDGSMMWAYAGHPLYTYAADTKPGEVSGDGLNQFGAIWHVAKAKGGGSYKPKPSGSYQPKSTGY